MGVNGINIHLAQAGFFVAAKEFVLYPYEYIFTRIGNSDNLFNDKTIYKQLIDFFEKALEAAYKKELLPKNWGPL